MITREEARKVAESWLSNKGSSLKVLDVLLEKEMTFAKPNVYCVDTSDSWIAYIEQPHLALQSSHIIVIDRKNGIIVYDGSAYDEG